MRDNEWEAEGWDEGEWSEEDSAASEWEESEDSLDTLPCPECGETIFEDSEQCPHCGEYILCSSFGSGGIRDKPWWWILIGIGGIIAFLLTALL